MRRTLKMRESALRKVPAIRHRQLGSRWTEVDERLGVLDDEMVMVKKAASALFGAGLAAIIASHRIDTVILCGRRLALAYEGRLTIFAPPAVRRSCSASALRIVPRRPAKPTSTT
jgi:hypothetical protein